MPNGIQLFWDDFFAMRMKVGGAKLLDGLWLQSRSEACDCTALGQTQAASTPSCGPQPARACARYIRSAARFSHEVRILRALLFASFQLGPKVSPLFQCCLIVLNSGSKHTPVLVPSSGRAACLISTWDPNGCPHADFLPRALPLNCFQEGMKMVSPCWFFLL